MLHIIIMHNSRLTVHSLDEVVFELFSTRFLCYIVNWMDPSKSLNAQGVQDGDTLLLR